jgi:ubiquitin-protein ligase
MATSSAHAATTSESRTATYLAQAEIAMEFSALQHKDHCPRGMYVIPSTESILLWDAVLFVHQGELRRTYDFVAVTVDASLAGYYADSVLKFRINFPADYPARSPSVTFLTDVFHPLAGR